MNITVELKNVTKRFGEVTAVDDINLKIRRGEFFSLLGPSGCGKTTTLRLVAGFEEPTKGKILINNINISNKRPYERNVNTVFQSYALFPHLYVAGNIRFGLERKKTPKSKMNKLIEEALDLVRMKGMENRYPRQLSGGQQQRVALARALILRPEVLLLDEPLGALDLKLRKEMQLELKSLQERVGITFIYVTHDQEEALTMSDRIAVMNQGEVLQVGKPQEIYEAPRSLFVADFIGETNLIPGIVTPNGNGLTFTLPDGSRTSAGWVQDGLTDGDQAFLSIRPEKVKILPPNSSKIYEKSTQLLAHIQQMIYVGTDTRFILELADNTMLVAREQNIVGSNQNFNIGEAVTVSWDKDQARVLGE